MKVVGKETKRPKAPPVSAVRRSRIVAGVRLAELERSSGWRQGGEGSKAGGRPGVAAVKWRFLASLRSSRPSCAHQLLGQLVRPLPAGDAWVDRPGARLSLQRSLDRRRLHG